MQTIYIDGKSCVSKFLAGSVAVLQFVIFSALINSFRIGFRNFRFDFAGEASVSWLIANHRINTMTNDVDAATVAAVQLSTSLTPFHFQNTKSTWFVMLNRYWYRRAFLKWTIHGNFAMRACHTQMRCAHVDVHRF